MVKMDECWALMPAKEEVGGNDERQENVDVKIRIRILLYLPITRHV